MRASRTNMLVIRTQEGIEFPLHLAGPLARFLAWIIDMACVTALTLFVSYLSLLLQVLSADIGMAFVVLVYFAISIGYGILLEWSWRGQTVGKRIIKLRVVDEQGLRLQFSQIVIRNLLRFVDGLPALYLVGGLACLISRHAQRLGDYAANTVVIRHVPEPDYDSAQIAAGKFNSFREYPHIEARLRQHVSAGEAAVALQALLRREELDPAERVRLFAELAAHFRALVPFPEEATTGLTDEQYVRNVVDSLARGVGKRS